MTMNDRVLDLLAEYIRKNDIDDTTWNENAETWKKLIRWMVHKFDETLVDSKRKWKSRVIDKISQI